MKFKALWLLVKDMHINFDKWTLPNINQNHSTIVQDSFYNSDTGIGYNFKQSTVFICTRMIDANGGNVYNTNVGVRRTKIYGFSLIVVDMAYKHMMRLHKRRNSNEMGDMIFQKLTGWDDL